ncbi:MAG: transcriptional regulator [Acidobacteria bacterium]|nr:MAG: transcriptional regulator [Acidobacteriota bacterium]
MDEKSENPFAGLERVFHEPVRTAIMTSLLGSPDGLTFNQLRHFCDTTDGNLSRHLRSLEDAGAVHLRKTFVGNRPRTTIFMSRHGRERFMHYLEALEGVLKQAAERIEAIEKDSAERAAPEGGELARS